MPTPPDLAEVQAYLVSASATYADAEVAVALDAERVAQAGMVRFPPDPDPPADPLPYSEPLALALMRRVHRNLAMRAMPLGYQQTASELGPISTRIGSDPEIGRLEAPYRKMPVG